MRYKILILLLFVTSCNSSAPQTPTALPISTLTPTLMVTEIPTATNTPIPIPEREKYTLNTTIDYDLHFVAVDETILYPNHTGLQLNSLTFAIAANLWPNCFKLDMIVLTSLSRKAT